MGSRWDEAEKAGKAPPLPPILEGAYLIKCLRDMRFCHATGFGIEPLSFAEIGEYGRATGGLEGREVVLLNKMSAAYCKGRRRGVDVFDQGPYPLRDEEGRELADDDPELRPWEPDDGGYQ